MLFFFKLGQYPKVVIHTDRKINIYEDGERVVIYCNITYGNEYNIIWQRNNMIIEDLDNYNFAPAGYGSHIVIRSFNRNLAGNYTCIANDSTVQVKSNNILRLQLACKTDYFE